MSIHGKSVIKLAYNREVSPHTIDVSNEGDASFMLTNILTSILVILEPIMDKSSSSISPQIPLSPSYIIKTISIEITFFNGGDVHIIHN